MNIDQIRELAEIVKATGLTELEITEGDLHIKMGRTASEVRGVHEQCDEATVDIAPVVSVAPVALQSTVDFNKTIEVKSSLIGVFYASPAPDAEEFVKVGSKVQKGDVLCIIEAMKLMNDIVAEQSGEVVDICVQNGDVVEFGQTLFKLC